MRDAPAEAQREHSEGEHDGRGDRHRGQVRKRREPGTGHDRGSDERRDGVQVGRIEQLRVAVRDYVAQEAAPTPVVTPSSAAATGFMPASSAFTVPVVQNSASPAASKISSGRE